MKAYALPAADQPVSFVDVPVPQAPEGGLLIRVRAARRCRSRCMAGTRGKVVVSLG